MSPICLLDLMKCIQKGPAEVNKATAELLMLYMK